MGDNNVSRSIEMNHWSIVDHRNNRTMERAKWLTLSTNRCKTVTCGRPVGRSSTDACSPGPVEWYPSKAFKVSWAPWRCSCKARGLTFGLSLDWERLRVKDMLLTFNCFLFGRALNNRQGLCDLSLDHIETKSQFRLKPSSRRDLQQRQAKQPQHLCKISHHDRFGLRRNLSITKAIKTKP